MARANGKDRGLFQRNGVWWIRWTCPYGHEHREKAGSKTLARQLYERRKTATRHEAFCLDEARARQKREENSSFDKVSEKYLEWSREHRPRSARFRAIAIKNLSGSFGSQHLGNITPQDWERHAKRRQAKGIQPTTLNRERAVLSHMFELSIKWGLVDNNPIRRTEHLKEDNVRPRPLTMDEERRLFAALPPHYQPVVTFALNTGLRLGEIQHQRWDDVDMAEGVLTVTRPKSGKHETIPLNTAAFGVLVQADRTSDVIFPRMAKSMSHMFRRYAAKAGVDASFHDLRDTFISRLAENVGEITLMKLARHRDFRTTQRYLKLDGNHLKDAVETLTKGQTRRETGTKNGTENFTFPQHFD